MLRSLRTILGIFPEYGYFPSIAHAILNALLNTFVLLSNYPSRCFVQTAICRRDAMTQFPGTAHRLRSNPETHKHTQRKLISVRDTLCSLFTPWQSLFYFLFLHASLLSSRPHLQTCLGTGGGRGRWGRGRGAGEEEGERIQGAHWKSLVFAVKKLNICVSRVAR